MGTESGGGGSTNWGWPDPGGGGSTGWGWSIGGGGSTDWGKDSGSPGGGSSNWGPPSVTSGLTRHFVLWYAPDPVSTFDDLTVCRRQLSTWVQTDDSDDVLDAIRPLSDAWAREHWCGPITFNSDPSRGVNPYLDVRDRLHIILPVTDPGGAHGGRAHLWVPAINALSGDNISADPGFYGAGLHSPGVLCSSYGDPCNSNVAEGGEYVRGTPNWPLVAPGATIHRRTTLWGDSQGNTVLDHFLHLSDSSSSLILFDQRIASNADYLWSVTGLVKLHEDLPPSPYTYPPPDTAYLTFSAEDRITKLAVPGPTHAMFEANEVTVSRDYIAPQLGPVLAKVLSPGGGLLRRYIGGRRVQKGTPRY